MEKPAKYEIDKDKFNITKTEKIIVILKRLGRKVDGFILNDIIVTKDNQLQQVGYDITPKEAMELLNSNAIKAFYPIESKVVLN